MARRWFLFPMTFVIGILIGISPALASTSLVFGVHPFTSADTLARMFGPLLAHLQRETGYQIKFRTAKDYNATLDALVRGEIQISYLGPVLYTIALDKHPGKIRLLGTVANKDGNPTFRALIIAKEGGAVNSFADLKGKKIAFGDRESTLSCYLPAYMLIRAGFFDTIQYRHLGSHDNVAKAVSWGLFDAGGIQPALAEKYVGKGVKVIAESEPVHEHVLVVSSTVDAGTVKKLRTVVRNIRDPAVLDAIHQGMSGFVATRPSDYDNLRAIMKEVDARMPK